MTITHTPGPWAYDAESQEVFSDDARHGAGWIAFIKGNDGEGRPLTEPERLANARLIAAAPDLLDALRGVMNWWAETSTPNGVDDEMPPKLFDAAWLAIARATRKA